MFDGIVSCSRRGSFVVVVSSLCVLSYSLSFPSFEFLLSPCVTFPNWLGVCATRLYRASDVDIPFSLSSFFYFAVSLCCAACVRVCVCRFLLVLL